MMDESTTALALPPHLAALRPLTVITNLALLAGLADLPGLTLIAVGGTYSRKFNGFFGLGAEEALRGLRADLALLSTSAIHDGAAFHQDREVVGIKRRMMRSAARSVLLADHAKFGRTALHSMAELDPFAGVVTGPGLDARAAHALWKVDVALEIAEAKDTA